MCTIVMDRSSTTVNGHTSTTIRKMRMAIDVGGRIRQTTSTFGTSRVWPVVFLTVFEK